MKPHTSVKVSYLPICNICKQRPAKYDGKTTRGPWANMCQKCFENYGVGLGLGKGQKLIAQKAKVTND